MSGSEDSTATAATAILESASAGASANKPMDRSGGKPQSNDDLLGDMINSAAMSILDGEDFTMGPVQVKWVFKGFIYPRITSDKELWQLP